MRQSVTDAVKRRRAAQQAQQDKENLDSGPAPTIIPPVVMPQGPKRKKFPPIKGGLVTGRVRNNVI